MNLPSPSWTLSWRTLSWLSLALLCALGASGCGARTALYGAFPCRVEGETQVCVDDCGDGLVTCEGGYWSKCRVPVKTATCENLCGQGSQTCADSTWGECVVPDVELPCENTCGAGTQLCSNAALGECKVPAVTRECASKCGTGTETCESNTWSVCTAPQPLPPVLVGTIRDFKISHPDFEPDQAGFEPGLVEETLGADGKPVYAAGSGSLTTTGAANFNQWFRDVDGINASTALSLDLVASPNDPRLYRYENTAFFPIDGQLFGNEGNPHNFHFTFEAEGSFVYQGGEVFRFSGDDDVWVFVNNQLIIDLGGTHETMGADVSLDDVASKIGLVIGGKYPLKMFFAERHTVASNFILETSISDLGPCP